MRRMSAGVVFTVLLMAPPLVWLFLGARVSAQDGKAVYERACAACHGDAGQGRLAPALVPFTRGSQELLRIVRAGAGTMMNGFSASDVSDADVRAIEQYLAQPGRACRPGRDAAGRRIRTGDVRVERRCHRPCAGARFDGSRPDPPGGVAVRRCRSEQQPLLDARRHHGRQRESAGDRVALAARGARAEGVRHGARQLHVDADHDRQRDLRDVELQPRRRARRRNRRREVGLRSARLRDRDAAAGGRVPPSRRGRVAGRAGRQQAAHLPGKPLPALQPRRRDRKAGRHRSASTAWSTRARI